MWASCKHLSLARHYGGWLESVDHPRNTNTQGLRTRPETLFSSVVRPTIDERSESHSGIGNYRHGNCRDKLSYVVVRQRPQSCWAGNAIPGATKSASCPLPIYDPAWVIRISILTSERSSMELTSWKADQQYDRD